MARAYCPGRSSIVNLSGEKAEGMALVEPAAMHLHMATLSDDYPDSLMGTVALARQSLASAIHYRDEWAAYTAAPLGKKRPRYDSGLEAWKDVVAGRLPLVVTASRENDVRRALALADEFKIRVLVAGAPQAARVAELIKARKLPLLVSVELRSAERVRADQRRRRRARTTGDRRSRAQPGGAGPGGRALRLRLWRRGDYVAGIRKAIERGLPREAALRAATLGAAEALGIADRLGSLERGKIANVVAWSGDPLTKEATVKMVFVDGRLYEPPAEDKKAARKKDDAGKVDAEAKSEQKKLTPWTPPVPPTAPVGVVAIVGGTLLTVVAAGHDREGHVADRARPDHSARR